MLDLNSALGEERCDQVAELVGPEPLGVALADQAADLEAVGLHPVAVERHVRNARESAFAELGRRQELVADSEAVGLEHGRRTGCVAQRLERCCWLGCGSDAPVVRDERINLVDRLTDRNGGRLVVRADGNDELVGGHKKAQAERLERGSSRDGAGSDEGHGGVS